DKNTDKEGEKDNETTPEITVDKIDQYENINISAWLNEETVVVSKDNEALGKMTLAELADSYPKSLYLFNINTKEYKLLKEQKDTNLGDATLSADKKYLLYSEFTLGDPAYYVMNLDTLVTFGIKGENIASGMSAHWAKNTFVGTAYSGDAYLGTTDGKINVIDGLEKEGLFIVSKIKDAIYFNTGYDLSLYRLNTSTKESTNLNLPNVIAVIPSPDENQMLVLQNNGSKSTLLLCDVDGGNSKTIAAGTEIEGISWSEDQRMIAYNLKADANGTTAKGLYIYDMLNSDSTLIAVDTESTVTAFSPSGKELVYSGWDGAKWNSSIVYFK
ncbi:MAG: hypothetical protein K0S61_2631, partial [Anaerocolumna sp.]|nr:hypothetical protein [Anaerocolumna sp.]